MSSAHPEALTNSLRQRQNEDGGWGYNRGPSWSEPTAFALLALHACGLAGVEFSRGIAWLLTRQRADGGWPPNDTAGVSCSVTSTCLLALGCSGTASQAYSAGLGWSLGQIKPDYTVAERFAHWLQGIPEAEAKTSGGVPWFPGTSAWLAPSVMATLVLRQAIRLGYRDSNLRTQVERLRSFLLSRRCPDAGWTQGGSQYRVFHAVSYPETTGMALLAFEPGDRRVSKTVRLARTMADKPGSCEAQSWLSLGLAHQGETVPNTEPMRWHTVCDLALQMISQARTVNPLTA